MPGKLPVGRPEKHFLLLTNADRALLLDCSPRNDGIAHLGFSCVSARGGRPIRRGGVSCCAAHTGNRIANGSRRNARGNPPAHPVQRHEDHPGRGPHRDRSFSGPCTFIGALPFWPQSRRSIDIRGVCWPVDRSGAARVLPSRAARDACRSNGLVEV